MKRKLLLYMLAALLICTGIAGYIAWNRPQRDVSREKGLRVSAEALLHDYTTDERKADRHYLDKALTVTGRVSGLDTNQDGQTVVLLATSDPEQMIACTLRTGERADEILPDETISLKGICSGLIADVVLTDCIRVAYDQPE